MLTDDSQIGANLRVCADEEDRAGFDHTIETIDALDALRDEIDEILRKSMSQVERKELDAATLFPLSVALNQAEAAIGARRAELMARPPAGAPAPAQVTPLRVASGE